MNKICKDFENIDYLFLVSQMPRFRRCIFSIFQLSIFLFRFCIFVFLYFLIFAFSLLNPLLCMFWVRS